VEYRWRALDVHTYKIGETLLTLNQRKLQDG